MKNQKYVNREKIIYALKHKADALSNKAETFKDDRDLVIFAIEQGCGFILQYANDSIKNDMEVALKTIDYYKGSIFIGETIRRDSSFIIQVIQRRNPYRLLCSPIQKPDNKISSITENKKSFRSHYYSALYPNINLDTAFDELCKFDIDRLFLQVGNGLSSMAMPKKSRHHINATQLIRQEIAKECVLNIPNIWIERNPIMSSNAYQLLIKGITVGEGLIDPDRQDATDVITNHVIALIKKHILIDYKDEPAIISAD